MKYFTFFALVLLFGCSTKQPTTPTVGLRKRVTSTTATDSSMFPVPVAAIHPAKTNVVTTPWTNVVPIDYAPLYHVIGPDHTNLVWVSPDELSWDLMRSTNNLNGKPVWFCERTNFDDSLPITNAGLYKVEGHWQRN